jgi:hypothetical protein
MDPPVSKNGNPDILITLDSDALFYNSEIVGNLIHGDQVRFNCTLHERERGSLKDVMHFHIDQLSIVGHDPQYALFTTEIE